MALDPGYSKAIKYIMQNQNGEAAQQMNKAGIIYNMNYGVSLMMLREFAKAQGENTDLAKQLWKENIRETKLLSLMMFNPEEISEEEADSLVTEFTNGELVENACHHLFWRMPFALQSVEKWIKSEETFVKMAGLFLGARIAKLKKELTDDTFETILSLLKPETEINVIYIKKSLTLLLLAIAGKSDNLKTRVQNFINDLDIDNYESCRFIQTNVSAEIEYL